MRSMVEGHSDSVSPSTAFHACWSEIVSPGHDLGLPGAVQSSNTLPIAFGDREDEVLLRTGTGR
jgi:hypothetical protein